MKNVGLMVFWRGKRDWDFNYAEVAKNILELNMSKLKPWYQVVTPREDLREGKPLDASEFAVHLDHIREKRAHIDYLDPERFFERTYLTESLKNLSIQVIRRLSGIVLETSAVFNMATQFGGGKTHSLTALYHLAKGGESAGKWNGVSGLLEKAQVKIVPLANVAVFVGTEFDTLDGRGESGEPQRRTPWGEIAWQIGRESSFQAVAQHDEKGIAPAGDVIRKMIPNEPTLILIDELLNYVCRARKSGISAQLYQFLQNLIEEASARNNLVVCVSIPASELEMTAEDQKDYDSYKKLLDRKGKAISMSSEIEITEIIRRRLFESYGHGTNQDALRTISAYSEWAKEHAMQIGGLGGDNTYDLFKACYPFHPSVVSVFERKWQSLPRFQRTRGILRLLALWVSKNWQEDYRRVANEPLITLGSAPLDDQTFRDAVFEELGSDQLSVPVLVDIVGKKEAHAVRLDKEANEEIRKGRLHQKVATIIFFESNGGQSLNKAEASETEIRAALGAADINLANVDTILEGLANNCFYLKWDRNRYKFGLQPNLNQILIQKRGSVSNRDVDEQVRRTTTEVFNQKPRDIEARCFITETNDIPDKPQLNFVVLGTEFPFGNPDTSLFIEKLVREHGNSGRVFKTALIVCVLDSPDMINHAARHFIALREITEDKDSVQNFDEAQTKNLRQSLERARIDMKESVWRAYKHIFLLGKDNKLTSKDLGLINSSMASSLPEYVINDLKRGDLIVDSVASRKLLSYWPPALTEWSTKAVRDAFFASPALPRLVNGELLKRTISDGVSAKLFAYARKDAKGKIQLEKFGDSTSESEVEISDDVYLLKSEDAQKLLEPPKLAEIRITPDSLMVCPGSKVSVSCSGFDQYGSPYNVTKIDWMSSDVVVDNSGQITAPSECGNYRISAKAGSIYAETTISVAEKPVSATIGKKDNSQTTLKWDGLVPHQKWMNVYTKVFSRFASNPGLRIKVAFEVITETSQANAKSEELKTALRDLGLSEYIELK